MTRLTPEFRRAEVSRYVEALHAPDATVAIALIPPDGGDGVGHRFVKAADLAVDRWLRFLAYQNAAGLGVYVTPCPLHTGARRRARESIEAVTSLWLDLDRDAGSALAQVTRRLPAPTLVVRTSPGRLQVLWRLSSALSVDEGESVLRGLASAFSGDRAATDASRVLRLPGFVNSKYRELPVSRRIVLIEVGNGASVGPEPFLRFRQRNVHVRSTPLPNPRSSGQSTGSATPPEIASDAELVRLWSGCGRASWGEDRTASERDLALAHGLRKLGVPRNRAAEILAESPNRACGRRKSDLAAYLALTLSRAGFTI